MWWTDKKLGWIDKLMKTEEKEREREREREKERSQQLVCLPCKRQLDV